MANHIMSSETAKKLIEKGYSWQNSDDLEDQLPEQIWITISDKNLKHLKAFFMTTRKDGKFYTSLSVEDPKTKELYIIHRVENVKRIDNIGKMLLFLEQNAMLEGV